MPYNFDIHVIQDGGEYMIYQALAPRYCELRTGCSKQARINYCLKTSRRPNGDLVVHPHIRSNVHGQDMEMIYNIKVGIDNPIFITGRIVQCHVLLRYTYERILGITFTRVYAELHFHDGPSNCTNKGRGYQLNRTVNVCLGPLPLRAPLDEPKQERGVNIQPEFYGYRPIRQEPPDINQNFDE